MSTGHVRVAADALGVSERAVWRLVAEAGRDERAVDEPGARARPRFSVTPEVRVLLALWKGNFIRLARGEVLEAVPISGKYCGGLQPPAGSGMISPSPCGTAPTAPAPFHQPLQRR